jgi:adenosyl cobinamide kinase/adenosyl cobinamide phosphate guanylyltransferase
MLKFKNPQETDLKKVMVYGMDGSGKSTFAANYCKQHNLNPVVIDVDDTNRTFLFSQGRVLDINMRTDKATFSNVKTTVEEIKDSEFDTIIIDGVTSLLELLVSDKGGIAKYGDRATRFQKILRALLDSKKHLIFIGQIDMEVIFTEDFQSPKQVIKVNSLVNEKYLCLVDEKGNYTYELKKMRTVEPAPMEQEPEEIYQPKVEKIPEPEVQPKKSEPQTEFKTAGEIGEPNPADDPVPPVKSQAIMIMEMLQDEGLKVTKHSMKLKAVKLAKEVGLPEDNKRALLDYISKHCPEELS